MDVARVIERQTGAFEELGGRSVTNGHEQAAHRKFFGATSDGVFEDQTGDLVFTQHVDDLTVPVHFHVGQSKGAFLHGLGGTEAVTPVNHMHGAGKLGEVVRLLHRGVSPTNDRHRLIAEHGQRSIADRTSGDPTPAGGQTHFVVEPQPIRSCPSRNDHRLCIHHVPVGEGQTVGRT